MTALRHPPDTGLCCRRKATAQTPISADPAFERVEKRLSRYKRRPEEPSRRWRRAGDRIRRTDYVLRHGEDEAPETDDHSPLVIAETQTTRYVSCPSGRPSSALDLADQPFLVFKNAASGQLNVVYKRSDGNVGWIDPATGKAYKSAR